MSNDISFSIEEVKNSFSVEIEIDKEGRYKFDLGGIGFIINPEEREFIILKRIEKDFFKDYRMPYPATFNDFLSYCHICGIEFFTLGAKD